MISTASDEEPSREQSPWNGRNLFAAAAAAVCCLTLLAGVKYCPTYAEDKASMLQLFLATFWGDLTNQLGALFSSGHRESLSGETTASEWTYCGMVPLIVIWLIWHLWPKLRQVPVRGEAAGYGILAAGFLIYVAGFLMENYYVGMGSMELIYAGLIVLFLGWGIMRVLLFPWAFLMFMWPYNFLEDVALQLRLIMSGLSHVVLQLIGVDNVLQGTAVVAAPGSGHPFAIDVADPCSGIRSLFALVMLAAVYAFLTFRKFWQQLFLVALAIPLVMLGNLVRIVLLTLATIYLGEHFALGTNDQPSWFHEGTGYLVYVINVGGLFLTGHFLTRLTPPSPKNAHA
jgi:exosortase